jgi:hypothetical protein
MRYHDNGSLYSVSVSPSDLRAFAATWPCSGMRNPSRGMWFQFEKSNGDLVDIKGERKSYDEGAVKALSEDAQKFAAKFLECANCSRPLPSGHGCHGPKGHRFCDTCAGIAEAMRIGARLPAMLYEDAGALNAVSWTGVAMGTIVHKRAPDLIYGTRTMRRLGAVRYRVRMLDGSTWHGTGPSSNGNYIRLRPMKGE